jgi:hypothetical protein
VQLLEKRSVSTNQGWRGEHAKHARVESGAQRVRVGAVFNLALAAVAKVRDSLVKRERPALDACL